MCFYELATLAVALWGAESSQDAQHDAKKQRNESKFASDQAKAQAEQASAARFSQQRKALRKNSLFTGGAESGARSTLGV